MEELQSTEILDREILEDARKKAYRILKTADDTVKTKSGEWEKKLAVTLDELEKKYSEQGKLAAVEIMAFLPMDKRRVKAEKIESLLHLAAKTWYTGLNRRGVLDLLEKELAKRLAACDEFAVSGEGRAMIRKIERAEAEDILKRLLPGKPFYIEETHSAADYPELVLETREERIYASIGKIVDYFLSEKRAELIEALLGRTVLFDNTALMGPTECTGGESPC